MAKPRIWIIGDSRQAIFSNALDWLAMRAKLVYVEQPTANASRAGKVSTLPVPTTILLVQSRPGQISQREVEKWHAVAPLARLVALIGPWCEGEMRSGRPWAGVVRVPWRQWQSRLPRELDLAGSSCNQRPLPRTISDTERIERESVCLALQTEPQRAALIHSDSRVNYEGIAGTLMEFGITSTWVQENHSSCDQHFDISVYDGWEQAPGNDPSAPTSPRGTPAILLLHFPRPQDYERAAAIGISRIVALPGMLPDLAVALERQKWTTFAG